MRKLMKYKVYFKPYIISLEDDPKLKTTYACMGEYLQVTKDADIPRAVNTIVTAFRPLLKITKADYKEIQTIAANAPSVLSVTIPEIKVTESEVIKPAKKSEPTIPKPPKADTVVKTVTVTPKDTVAKPETKIKVDQAPAKLPVDHIVRLRENGYSPLYTAIPAPKLLKTVQLPAVDIVAPPSGEAIAPLAVSGGKPFGVPEPVLKKIKGVDNMPAVDIVVPNEQEHITGLALASPKPFSATPQAPKNLNTVASLPAPEIKTPATLPSEDISRLTPAQPKTFATGSPDLKKMSTVQPGVKVPPVVVDTPATPKNKVEQMAAHWGIVAE